MTWIWATLLLILSAPFVLWPLLRVAPPGAADEGDDGGEADEADEASARESSAPDG